MAQILFNQNIDLAGFNFGTQNISYPSDQRSQLVVDDATKESIVYSFVNNVLCDETYLYGRYKSQTLSRDKFIIYRQASNENIKTYLGTIDGITDGFYDYNINNNQKYKYIVETNPVDTVGNAPSVSLETDYYLNPHWTSWSICDIEKDYDLSSENQKETYIPSDTVFIIKNNLNIGAINDNLNIIKYNTLGKFGKTIKNSQKYDSGNISCLIADIVGCQDIKSSDKLFIIKDNIYNVEDIDKFFINLRNEYDNIEEFNQAYFLFPTVSDQYYQYNINYGKEVYVPCDDEPNNWEDTFKLYYVLDNNNKTYHNAICEYELLQEKPDNWDNEYYLYYDIEVLGDNNWRYVENNNTIWEPNKYYKIIAPKWEKSKYYIKAISCGTIVPSKNVIMNTLDTLQAWRNCLSNGKLKLLKSPNGQSWIVSISDQTQLNVAWQAHQFPASIDFSWQEVVDKEKISIIKW